MVKYIIVHNKHEGCYDVKFFEDEKAKKRYTSITINPPKIYMFDNKTQAGEFFEEYIHDVDITDPKCKKDDDIEHTPQCTCGTIEVDEEGNPILFYNKTNQIFLLEHGPQIFMPHQDVKIDINNINMANKMLSKYKTLGKEQRDRYIELGKLCQECNDQNSNKQDSDMNTPENIKYNIEVKFDVSDDTPLPAPPTPANPTPAPPLEAKPEAKPKESKVKKEKEPEAKPKETKVKKEKEPKEKEPKKAKEPKTKTNDEPSKV